MDLNDMKVFLAIVQTGSITAAADSLFISQPTISYRMKNLEKELGVRLIQRGQGIHCLDLTPAGERLVEYAQRWLDLSREIMSIKSDLPAFELQIGSVDSVNLYLLMPFYELLSREFPSAKLRIRTQQTLEIYHMIETRELDAGFVLREVESGRFHLEPVFREKMLFVRKRGKTDSAGIIHAQDLDPRRELYIEWSPAFVAWHNRMWDSNIPPYLWIDSVPLMNSFLCQPGYWGICPESVVATLNAENRLEVLELAETPPERVTYFVTHTAPTATTSHNLKLFRQVFDLFRKTHSAYPAQPCLEERH